jgi:hypothetical protein
MVPPSGRLTDPTGAAWKQIKRRYQGNDGIQANGIVLFNPGSISVTR